MTLAHTNAHTLCGVGEVSRACAVALGFVSLSAPARVFARSPVFGRYLLSTHRTIHVIVRLLACVRVS